MTNQQFEILLKALHIIAINTADSKAIINMTDINFRKLYNPLREDE